VAPTEPDCGFPARRSGARPVEQVPPVVALHVVDRYAGNQGAERAGCSAFRSCASAGRRSTGGAGSDWGARKRRAARRLVAFETQSL